MVVVGYHTVDCIVVVYYKIVVVSVGSVGPAVDIVVVVVDVVVVVVDVVLVPDILQKVVIGIFVLVFCDDRSKNVRIVAVVHPMI